MAPHRPIAAKPKTHMAAKPKARLGGQDLQGKEGEGPGKRYDQVNLFSDVHLNISCETLFTSKVYATILYRKVSFIKNGRKRTVPEML